MTTVNRNNGNETKSDIVPWGIFKSDTIYFSIKKYSGVSMTFKTNVSQFYDFSEPKQRKWNKTRHFFMGEYSNLTSFFLGHKILKSFNFIAKVCTNKWNEIKRDMCKCDSIFSYLQCCTLFKWLLKVILW